MTTPPIDTVIFDLGNVLVTLDDREAWQRIAAVAGRSAGEVRSRFVSALDQMVAYETGRLNSVEYYHALLQALEIAEARYPYADFRDNWCAVLARCPEMEQLFYACCAARTTCVLSNTNDLHWSYVAGQLDVLTRAHHTLVSFQCGLYKPQREIFELALQRFGVSDPAAAVFIDDREENVAAARAVGLVASFQHTSADDTRARLVALGVL